MDPKGNAELFELSAKNASQFCKAFKASQNNACPVELISSSRVLVHSAHAHFQAFRALKEPAGGQSEIMLGRPDVKAPEHVC